MSVDTFGSYVRARRLAEALTQSALAEAAGVGVPYISRIENDRERPPSDEVLMKLADVLKIKSDWLFVAARRLPPDVAALAKADPYFVIRAVRTAVDVRASMEPGPTRIRSDEEAERVRSGLREVYGGYPSGNKRVEDLKPPPSGPGAGGKRLPPPNSGCCP